MNFYNEIDPFAAAWLRELIKAGHIAPGVVDERSIEDITPDELRQYTQCHFFAGIGVWSYALRCAGWPDDKPVWTGSCPCQPFSTAGQGKGTTDERHLWPSWFHLIQQCRPSSVFGEQVEAAIRFGWLDTVQADLEGIGYTFGAAGLCAAGFGAPHIRPRLYFVGRSLEHTNYQGLEGRQAQSECSDKWTLGASGVAYELGNSKHNGRATAPLAGGDEAPICNSPEGSDGTSEPSGASNPGTLPGPTNGFWSGAEWLYCGDQKYRPVESGVAPLVNGAPNRVGRLRGYGNAIVAPCAEAFIKAAMEAVIDRAALS